MCVPFVYIVFMIIIPATMMAVVVFFCRILFHWMKPSSSAATTTLSFSSSHLFNKSQLNNQSILILHSNSNLTPFCYRSLHFALNSIYIALPWGLQGGRIKMDTVFFCSLLHSLVWSSHLLMAILRIIMVLYVTTTTTKTYYIQQQHCIIFLHIPYNHAFL